MLRRNMAFHEIHLLTAPVDHVAAYADRCGIADMPRRRTRDRATAKPDRAAAEAEAIAAGSPSARSWPSTCAARAEISARMAIGRGKK